ncbi:MAG TPA: transporter [Thermoanaerobaculia bacterium]|nr:transporter [Thermoanaerobaculia bacterium]
MKRTSPARQTLWWRGEGEWMRVAATVFLLLIPMFTRAQEASIVADRPGLADGSTTVGRGMAQLETGLTGEGGDEEQFTLPTLVRYGITDRLELRIASDVVGWTSDDGDIAPIAAGFKLSLRDGALPLSLIASVQPPSGEGRLRSSAFEGEARLVSDIDLAEGLSLTPNVGVALVEGDGAVAIFAATVEREMGRALPFVDFEATIGDGDTSMIADAGIAWVVRPNTQLDISVGVDVLGDEYPEWFIAAGYSRRF